MPSFRDEADRSTWLEMKCWQDNARELIEKIGMMRSGRLKRETGSMPWFPTAILCDKLRNHFPPINPKPLEKVDAVVSAWFLHGESEGLPAQSKLVRWYETAINRLESLAHAIRERMVASSGRGDESGRKRMPKRRGRRSFHEIDAAEAADRKRAVDGWKSNVYRSYEACARELGQRANGIHFTGHFVGLAVDSARKPKAGAPE